MKSTATENQTPATATRSAKDALEQLLQEADALIAPLGYEAVAIEQSLAPKDAGRTLTLFIDFRDNDPKSLPLKRISLDDCVKVNAAVDALFEETPLLQGHYNLEVSSPGVERPLKKLIDFNRFTGHKARLHTFRSLTKEELQNAKYWETHQKQKNFSGFLKGTEASNIQLEVDKELIAIPFNMISKAHLEFSEEVK